MKKIEEDINHIIVKTSDDMKVLEGQIKDETILKQVQAFYFSHIAESDCLSSSLKYGMNVIESNKKLEELKNKRNATNSEQNITNSEQNVQKNENLIQIDFRVIATKEQFMNLKQFLESNNIEYRRI